MSQWLLDHGPALANLAIGVLVLAVQLGRWGGAIEARAARKKAAAAAESVGNGTPTYGELLRAVEDMKRDREKYVSRDAFDLQVQAARREHDEIWGAVKNLREVDAAHMRRLDDLMGQA